MKVFFPEHCLNYESGFIFGWKKEKEDVLFAVTVIFLPDFANNFHALCEKIVTLQHNLGSISFLGVWLNENQGNTYPRVLAAAKDILNLINDELVVLRLPKHSSKPLLYSLGGHLKEAVFTLYKQPLVNAFLTAKTLNLNGDNSCRSLVFLSSGKNLAHFPGVLIILNKSRKAEESIRSLLLEEHQNSKTANGILNLFHVVALWTVNRLRSLATLNRGGIALFWSRVARFLSNSSAVFVQSRIRFRQVAALCDSIVQSRSQDHSEVKSVTKSKTSSSNVTSENDDRSPEFSAVSFGNLITAISLDVALGLAFVLWVFSDCFKINATDFIMEQTDLVVQFLSALLEQLKGAPVGLKLNKQLAECLSWFFLWHIYLWKIYLSFIEPYLQTIVTLTLISGCFGMTFLFSLASDVLSLLTLHIYCFYVYAARLYRFQVEKLIMLAKLFTGRRWNVEKNQDDNVPYKVDRLFLGTLLFVVLLFLLPTTAVFYIVFTALRLMVLLVKGLISRAVDGMNNLPVFALVMAFLKPDMLPGSVMLALLDVPQHCSTESHLELSQDLRPVPAVYLSLQYQPVHLTKLLCWQSVDKCMDDMQHDYDWVSLLGKVARGELVYPWVNKEKNNPLTVLNHPKQS